MKQNIKKLGYILLSTFVAVFLYLTYIVMQQGEALATHPQNRRLAAKEAEILRGTIYDSNGVILAETKWVGEQGQRVYLKEGGIAPFAHVVGYVSERYGSSGLEAAYGRELLGLTDADMIENLLDQIFNRRPQGNDLVLTLDARIQRAAQRALGKRRGAVVVLEPATGAILAMVSAPGYDTNALKDKLFWEHLSTDETNAPLLNRATQGAYPPGSVIKLVTGSAIIEKQSTNLNDKLNCPGYLMVDGQKLADNKTHGNVDFTDAMAFSCNTYFASQALKLGWGDFMKTAEKFGLNQAPDLAIDVRAGTLATEKRKNKSQLAETAIGQGDTLVSPLHMAMVCGAIANGGVIMQPYLVKEIRKPDSKLLLAQEAKPWLTATTPEVAEVITQGMLAAVERGTAGSAALRGVRVAGKTGTAETKNEANPNSLPHSWFVGFAPADNPRVAVAVILEKAGSGGAVAAPVAREVMAAALARR